jgi:hypothetical protein
MDTTQIKATEFMLAQTYVPVIKKSIYGIVIYLVASIRENMIAKQATDRQFYTILKERKYTDFLSRSLDTVKSDDLVNEVLRQYGIDKGADASVYREILEPYCWSAIMFTKKLLECGDFITIYRGAEINKEMLKYI